MTFNPLALPNPALALARRDAALANMDAEQERLRASGFNLEDAAGPSWNRATWEAYKAQFGRYPFGPENKPPDVLNAPAWVKELCGIRLNPAERMR